MKKYTIEELEEMVSNQSQCYRDSEVFQMALEYVKSKCERTYMRYLYREAVACGAINE